MRWGHSACPTTSGAETVYNGIASGSGHWHYGGGANYLCLPREADYYQESIKPKSSYFSYLYGAKYQHTLVGTHDYNVPCSVCYVSSRAAKMTIPAKTTCPPTWTEEYKGYLMTDRWNHKQNVVYECVDKDAEGLSAGLKNKDGAMFYHVVATDGSGLPCPPYTTAKTISCIVCTK